MSEKLERWWRREFQSRVQVIFEHFDTSNYPVVSQNKSLFLSDIAKCTGPEISSLLHVFVSLFKQGQRRKLIFWIVFVGHNV